MTLPLTDRVVDVEQYVVNVLTIWVTVVVPSTGAEVPAIVVLLAADTVAAKATNAARIERCIFDL